jgi:hypothetical protein
MAYPRTAIKDACFWILLREEGFLAQATACGIFRLLDATKSLPGLSVLARSPPTSDSGTHKNNFYSYYCISNDAGAFLASYQRASSTRFQSPSLS